MNIKLPEKRETFDGEGYEQGYNDAIDACQKAVEEAQKQELTKGCPACGELYGKHNKRDKYKANFCFGNNDPFDDLMYEFANAHTEEYREEVFKNIKEMFKQEPALVPIDQAYFDLIMNLGALTQRPGDARDIQRSIAMWEWPDKEEALNIIALHDSRDQAILKLKKFLCSKFGVPQQKKPSKSEPYDLTLDR